MTGHALGEEVAVTEDSGWLEPTRYELQRLLGLVQELQTRADAVRGSVAEAPIRARIVEAMEGAELLLGKLRATGSDHFVDSVFEFEGDIPMDVRVHVEAADREYQRAHYYAKGWTEAQPSLAASTRPRGKFFDERYDAFAVLIADRYDHEVLGDGHGEWDVAVRALAYATGHGWYLDVREAELDEMVRAVAPHLVPERLDALDEGPTG